MARVPMNFTEVPTIEELRKPATPGNYNIMAETAGLTVNPDNVVFSEIKWVIQDSGDFEGKAIHSRFYLGDAELNDDGSLAGIDRSSDWGAALLRQAFDACGVTIDPERGPDTDDILGRTCNGLITVQAGDSDREFNRIEGYFPIA